jgi:hypothetical protein
MPGQSCPACGGPLVSYGTFLCEVDVNTVIRCTGCGVPLRRSRLAFAVFGALGVCFVIAGFAVVRVTLDDPTGGGMAALALFCVAVPPAFLLLAKFISWMFVPWVPAQHAAPARAADRAAHNGDR